jgi:hypothetical protein
MSIGTETGGSGVRRRLFLNFLENVFNSHVDETFNENECGMENVE